MYVQELLRRTVYLSNIEVRSDAGDDTNIDTDNITLIVPGSANFTLPAAAVSNVREALEKDLAGNARKNGAIDPGAYEYY
jgi:hypothetical protein